MSSLKPWTCDGVPKNGKDYPNSSGSHEPYENYGSDCAVCGLPREAMEKGKPSTPVGDNSQLVKIGVIAGAILVLGGLIFTGSRMLFNKTEETNTSTSITNTSLTSIFLSDSANNSQLISQGEKILLEQNSTKQAAASDFSQENWDGAIASYQQAVANNPNDPESKIYLNNAKARKTGNPLTIAVVAPISNSPDSAKEILRGVASQQEEFNQIPSASGQLLEVVIANNSDVLKAASIAKDLINFPNLLGVVGYGIDPGSQQALRQYTGTDLVALSPLTTSITSDGKLQTIPLDQKQNELLGNYLQGVSKTLLGYAQKQNSSPAVVVFYNSDSPYSMQLKQELITAISSVNGQLIKEVDVTNSTPTAELASVQGANTIMLALSKNKVSEAVQIAQANNNKMTMIGGDELYNPDLLIQGGNSIKGITLAVPWSFKPNDPFAQDAVSSWKGRVSWRTATAYDATKALTDAISQNPTRNGVSQLLNQGMVISGNTTSFNIFQEVPLVQAVEGKNGPPGSNFQFDPI
jgi:ABC-type branched-subunit amino acid transport system substrate-binding protein